MRRNSYYMIASLLLLTGAAGAYAEFSGRPHAETQSAPRVADALTPAKPEVKGEYMFDPSTETGWVRISLTVPSKALDDKRNESDIEGVDRVEIYRYADFDYDHGQLIQVWSNTPAGARLEFDDRGPLEPRIEYTYQVKTVRHGVDGESAYAYVTYGINPSDPNPPALATADKGEGPVTVSFTCPDATIGDYWDPRPFPAGVKYSEIRLYKKDGTQEKVLMSESDPTPGKAYEYVDTEVAEGYNTYYLRTFTPYGFSAEVSASAFLGKDYPARVMNVEATESAGGVVVTWDAPTQGFRGGYLDPSTLAYRICRLDNDYGENPVLLADHLTECRFTDDLAGLEKEQMAYYRVYPYNDVETPAGTYNYGDSRVGILVGPAAPLPFRETFNAGSKFNKVPDNSWEEDFGSYSFNSHYVRNDVSVDTPAGSRDVTQGVDGPGTPETGADAFYYVQSGSFSSSTDPGYLTSGNLSLADASNPKLTLSYIPVAGSCGRMDVQVSTGQTDDDGNVIFADVATVDFSLDEEGNPVEAATPLQWRRFTADLGAYAGLARTKLRLAFRYADPSEGRYEMLVDDIALDDYPAATDLTAEYDGESRISLTWNLPESAGQKEVSYDVYLADRLIATTTERSYEYEGAEQGETYAFAVVARYPAAGFDAPRAEAEPLAIPLVDFTIGDFYYMVSDGAVSLHAYNGAATEISIPATVDYKGRTYDVTHIMSNIFKGRRDIRSVEILARVEELPANLFYGCVSLSEVKIPQSVSLISDHAFFGCVAMEKVELPEALETVEASAFRNCTGLTSIRFGASLKRIGEMAFSGCKKLSKVTFSTSEPPTVESGAFSGIAADCVGECPDGSAGSYSSAENLSQIRFPTAGVGGVIGADGSVTEYFSTSGVRLAAPEAGRPVIVRVKRADGTVETSRRAYRR